MKTNYIPQLQRDMYAGWDSGAPPSKPMKELKIQNVQKLAGFATTKHPNSDYKRFLCASVSEKHESYNFIFHNAKWNTIEVSVLKMPHNQYDHNLGMRIVGYTALIRHIDRDTRVASDWWKERPFLTQTGVQSKDEFLKAMGELCNRYMMYVNETEYKNRPWYNKFWDKTKEFIHSI